MKQLEGVQSHIDRCSKCGTCQAVCPLFGEEKRETLVARGKIFLLDALEEGKLEWSPRMAEVVSTCLLCRSCEASCPNGVRTDLIVLAYRERLAKAKGLSFWKKTAFQYLINSRGRLTLAAKLLYLYQHSGLQRLVRSSGLLPKLPWSLREKESLLPAISRRSFHRQAAEEVPAQGKQKWRVGYFYGCMTNFAFPETGQAMVKLLTAHGAQVVLPKQVCCGLPALVHGDFKTAASIAAKNLEFFRAAGADRILVDCASCGTFLKEYGDLLAAHEAREFSAKVRDWSEYFTRDEEYKPGLTPVEKRVTYHDPCHLKRHQGVSDPPRRLLRQVPGLSLLEMEGADRCCGAAGSFNMTHYRLSEKVSKSKIDSILATGADLVTTGCPACRMQLARGLKARGSEMPALHPVELLAASLQSDTAPSGKPAKGKRQTFPA
ncbi:MAG: (Fe-S)-binding protein [Bacillota bacterium]